MEINWGQCLFAHGYNMVIALVWFAFIPCLCTCIRLCSEVHHFLYIVKQQHLILVLVSYWFSTYHVYYLTQLSSWSLCPSPLVWSSPLFGLFHSDYFLDEGTCSLFYLTCLPSCVVVQCLFLTVRLNLALVSVSRNKLAVISALDIGFYISFGILDSGFWIQGVFIHSFYDPGFGFGLWTWLCVIAIPLGVSLYPGLGKYR